MHIVKLESIRLLIRYTNEYEENLAYYGTDWKSHKNTINLTNEPRREKTCLRGVRQREFQTSLPCYRYELENRNFNNSKLRYDAFQTANNKGADQTARMRRLVCDFVVRKPRKTGFLTSRPKSHSGEKLCFRGFPTK